MWNLCLYINDNHPDLSVRSQILEVTLATKTLQVINHCSFRSLDTVSGLKTENIENFIDFSRNSLDHTRKYRNLDFHSVCYHSYSSRTFDVRLELDSQVEPVF